MYKLTFVFFCFSCVCVQYVLCQGFFPNEERRYRQSPFSFIDNVLSDRRLDNTFSRRFRRPHQRPVVNNQYNDRPTYPDNQQYYPNQNQYRPIVFPTSIPDEAPTFIPNEVPTFIPAYQPNGNDQGFEQPNGNNQGLGQPNGNNQGFDQANGNDQGFQPPKPDFNVNKDTGNVNLPDQSNQESNANQNAGNNQPNQSDLPPTSIQYTNQGFNGDDTGLPFIIPPANGAAVPGLPFADDAVKFNDNYAGAQGIPLSSETTTPPSLTPVEDKVPETTTLAALTPVPASDVRHNVNFGPAGIFHETCQTVDNEPGSCINLLNCSPYLELLTKAKKDASAFQKLRKAQCGFEGSNPKVCCPIPGIPEATVATKTTPTPTTTTTTTAAPAPSGKSIGDGDFLDNFPEPPVCGSSNTSLSRVVGGVNAKLGAFPWMALLGYKDRRSGDTSWKCGGSLISSRHVLTAAHCIHNHETELYLVRLGELDLAREDEGATPVDVLIKEKMKHENYSPKSYSNDIAVLLLDKDVQFTTLIKPICMPKNRELRAMTYEDFNPLIAGWGDTEFRGPKALHLQVLQLPVVSNDYCAKAYSKFKEQLIDERVLCAGFKRGGKDACQGDSGGPLMQPIYNPEAVTTYIYQIGVVSFGKNCAEAGYPGVYSRVTHFVPWLEEKVLGRSRR